jgi:F-type H+-transporting ATPase subunit a
VENTQETKKRRIGYHRWLIVGLIFLNIYLVSIYAPVLPHIQVPGEIVGSVRLPVVGDFLITNTLVGTALSYILLLLCAFFTWRGVRKGTEILTGIAGIFEIAVEGIHNLVESTAGQFTKRIFPWVATIILVVLFANWLEIFPGTESIGWLEEAHAGEKGHPADLLFTIGDVPVATIKEGEVEPGEEGFNVVPWVRIASTDLNFTLALALISVTMTQIIGLRALGLGYLKKFFNFGPFIRMWAKPRVGPFDLFMPFLDIFVGLLEFIAEIAKIISFSFRLFGNIFAGGVLLFVIGTLIPVVLQSGVVLFEIFVGAIQALVFGMLTLVFMTMATQSHDDHDEGHEENHG